MRFPLNHTIMIPTITMEGKLSFAEAKRHIPFKIKRFYMVYSADDGAVRGLHAHKKLEQVLFCVRGSLTIVLDDGEKKVSVLLDSPEKGLYVGNDVWREIHGFTKDSMLLVVASEVYKESDYIRNYDDFLAYVKREPLLVKSALRNLFGAVSRLGESIAHKLIGHIKGAL